MADHFGDPAYSRRGVKVRDDDDIRATPWSSRWTPPQEQREPIPTETLRAVLGTLDMPRTALDVASRLGMDYRVAFDALELLLTARYVVPVTNGRYRAVRPIHTAP